MYFIHTENLGVPEILDHLYFNDTENLVWSRHSEPGVFYTSLV
jgi:hypothetical protein